MSVNSMSPRADGFADAPQIQPLPRGRGKPRILYFIIAYPNFSETYMHEEIRSLQDEFDIAIITFRKSPRPREVAFEYEMIPYQAPCLVYGQIEAINLDFNDPPQQEFLTRVNEIIEDFKPDVLHGHYLGMSLLLSRLSEQHRIPFTIRTHSMDILSEPDRKLEACCNAANSPWNRRVLAFPAYCGRLTDHGLNADILRSCWPVLNFQRFYKPEKRPPTGRVMCAGPAIVKKAHKDFIDLAAAMQKRSNLSFTLYAAGPTIAETQEYNAERGDVAAIDYIDPDAMADVYPLYDWVVYPSDPEINKVGLPLVLAEAQASGLGVCWQELPGRREEQLEFLGGSGFLFKSIEEVPKILSQPYPEEKRQLGFEAARRCDIEEHKHLLSDVWSGCVGDAYGRDVARAN